MFVHAFDLTFFFFSIDKFAQSTGGARYLKQTYLNITSRMLECDASVIKRCPAALCFHTESDS